jgi:CheY-like chemotaxis protein
MVRKLTHQVLAHQGYVVFSCRSAEEALDLIRAREGPLDILITDVVMPVMGGPDLAGRLGSLRPRIKVLYISGYSQEDLPGGSEEGTARLQKPFTPAALARKVRELLDGCA